VAIFPNAKIIGNYEKPKFMGELEVYLRGAGWKKERDQDKSDRYFVYKKSQTGKDKFPESEAYMDSIICIALLYGDTFRMAGDQKITREELEQ